jgi:hypothetical protein
VKPRFLALLVVLLVTTACRPADAGRLDTRRVDTGLTAEALALLRDWDDRRSRAWTEGDAEALTGLYTPGSRSGRKDRAMLAAWATRGLRVTGLQVQVLDASLRSWTPGRITLEVTDRVIGAHAVSDRFRVRLPEDRPSTRVISLRRVAGAWLVAEVRPVPTPAPP